MNDREAKTHQTLVRSREVFAQWVDDFAAGGAARQEFADLQAAITEVEHQAAAHGTGRSNAMQGTQTQNEAREALVAGMLAIREAAKVMNVEDKFPYPPRNNDERLSQVADVYATNALPLKPQFIAHELAPDFLEDLAADKTAFEAAIAARMNAVGDHIAAREELGDALARGLQHLRNLTSLVKVKYVNNPGKLAEWMAASHIERSARRAAVASGGATPPAPPTP